MSQLERITRTDFAEGGGGGGGGGGGESLRKETRPPHWHVGY